MQFATIWMAGLALLMLGIWLRGLFTSQIHQETMRADWARGWRVLFREFWLQTDGVLITYTSKFSGFGTATPPTAQQASQLPVQTAQINLLDTDAQAVVVHNWGSLPGAVSFASYLFPEIFMYCSQTTSSPSSFQTNFTFGLANTNSITINKLNVGTGSGGTFNLIMRVPHTISG